MFENESLSFEEQTIIQAAERYVQQELANEASGHDWWHIYRVTQLAKTIAEKEQANLFLCILTALLHDIGDEKFNESEEAGLLTYQQSKRITSFPLLLICPLKEEILGKQSLH